MRYPVAEIFHSLQGEGANAGRAAAFIRLGGCDNGCPWCDSKWAQTTRDCRWMSAAEIAGSVVEMGACTAVVTGGEPLLRDLESLTGELHRCNVTILLETSGTRPLSGEFDWICLSPKPFAPALDEVFRAADELKVVVGGEEDLRFAEECASKCGEGCRLNMQPEWNNRGEVIPLIVDYIKRHPQWRLSLQTHKFIDIP